MKKKLLIIGHGRHGKDTVAEILRDNFGYRFQSSSWWVCKKHIYPTWGKDHYNSIEECYDDRHSDGMRKMWYDMIAEYNTPDETRTASEMLAAGNHMYVGMRRSAELEACKKAGLFDLIVWVDRSLSKPLEDPSSMQLFPTDADVVVDNNRDIEYLIEEMYRMKSARLV